MSAEEKTYHGDTSGLPLPDFSKKYETHEFTGAQREISTRTIEFREAVLPKYGGHLESLSFSKWENQRPDVYGKTLELRRFDSKTAAFGDKPTLFQNSTESAKQSGSDGKMAPYGSNAMEMRQKLDTPRTIAPEDLKDAINHGGSPEGIRVGHGTQSRKIGGAPTEKSETSIPPKWEPAK